MASMALIQYIFYDSLIEKTSESKDNSYLDETKNLTDALTISQIDSDSNSNVPKEEGDQISYYSICLLIKNCLFCMFIIIIRVCYY
jgi:hypothetical protein